MRPLYRVLLVLTLVLPEVRGNAQVMVPFVSDAQRFMVFAEKRFIEIDVLPPSRYWSQNGAVLYQGSHGGLAYFELDGRRMRVVERGRANDVRVSGDHAAWMVHDTLKVLRSGVGVVVATGVDRFTVSDSLVAFVDGAGTELNVLWRGQRLPIAVLQESGDVRWEQGVNTMTYYDRSRSSLLAFQHGELRTVVDSADVGVSFCGADILAYWDDLHNEFIGESFEGRQRLSGLRPINAKAGDGALAFVDGTLKLKYWDGKEVVTLTDSMPSDYWVEGRVVLYLDAGRLKMVAPDGPMDVAEIVPEQWQVQGDRVVYLNANRELWAIHNGMRSRLGKEAAIDGFEVHGDAILYRSPKGPVTIIKDGRTFVY